MVGFFPVPETGLASPSLCHMFHPVEETGLLLGMGSQPAAAESTRILISTPGGKLSRLFVRISNCSRDFRSICGLRKTVYRSIRVGKGVGPCTMAPVRCAVSTI